MANEAPQNDDLASLFRDVKKLLILRLLRDGATTEEIGSVLGVSYKTIERLAPLKKRKRK